MLYYKLMFLLLVAVYVREEEDALEFRSGREWDAEPIRKESRYIWASWNGSEMSTKDVISSGTFHSSSCTFNRG